MTTPTASSLTDRSLPRRSRGLFAAIAVACAIAAPGTRAEPPGVPLHSEQRTISLSGGATLTLEAGRVETPESRARPGQRRVTIPYYRLRSTAHRPGAPIFMLAGGPGVAALDEFETDPATREIAVFLRSIGDVVLFDQRGAGRSRPRLDCSQRIEWPLTIPLTRAVHAMQLRKQAVRCRDHWLRQGVDLAAYNTLESAADVDALRKALGYERISLLAHSYGTHLALALIRGYRQTLERVILHGVEGPDHTYDLPSVTLQTLGRIAAAAEKSPVFAGQIPEGGLLAALAEVQKRLEASPVAVTVEHEGRPVTITLTRHDVQRLARWGTYDRMQLGWPAHVIRMHRGDFTLAAHAVLEARAWPIDSAMYFMMDCASGLSAARRARIERDPRDSAAQDVLGNINFAYAAACQVWNAPDLGEAFRSDVHSDVPVLIVQGTFDLSTAHENAVEVARGLPNSTLVTVEGGSHFTIGDLFESWPAVRRMLGEFLRTGRVSGPRHIVLPEPRFVPARTATGS